MKKAAVYCVCVFLLIVLAVFIRNGCIRAEYTNYLKSLPSREVERIEVQSGGKTINVENAGKVTEIVQALSGIKLSGRADVSFPGAVATVITVFTQNAPPVRMTLPAFGISENNGEVKAYFRATIEGKSADAMLARLLP